MPSVSDIREMAHSFHVEKVCGRADFFAQHYRALQNWLKDPKDKYLNTHTCKFFRGSYCDGLLTISYTCAYISSEQPRANKFSVGNKS